MSAPVVTTQNLTWLANSVHPVSDMLSVQSAAPIIQYNIWQSLTNTGGEFRLNGVRPSYTQELVISAADFAHLTFVAGPNALVEHFQIRVYDGAMWSAAAGDPWSPFEVSVVENLGGPILHVQDTVSPKFTEFDLAQMFTATLDNGRAIVSYEASSVAGRLMVGGVLSQPNQVVSISISQMQTALVETTDEADTIKLRAFDGTNWGPWASFHIALSNIYGPKLQTPPQGWKQLNLNVQALATAQNPIPPTRRVLVDWTNNTGEALSIARICASLGLPMPTPLRGQYLYAVQIQRATGIDSELVYPGGSQDSPGLSGGVIWNDLRDYPEGAFVLLPSDKLHFVVDGYTMDDDFLWQVNFQVYFR